MMSQARSGANGRSRKRFSGLAVQHGAPRWSPHHRTSDSGVTLAPLKPRQPGRIDPSRHKQAHPCLVPTLGGNMSGNMNSGPGGGKRQVELLLRRWSCWRDRRGPRRQADPFQVSTDRASVVK